MPTEAAWRVRDLRGTLEVSLPAGDHASPGFTGGFVPHPRQTALFGRYADGPGTYVAKTDAAGLQVFRHCNLAVTFGGFQLSTDGRLAFILCTLPMPSSQWQMVVVDTATGGEIRRVMIGTGIPSAFALSADATELLTVRTYSLPTSGPRPRSAPRQSRPVAISCVSVPRTATA